MNQPSDLTAPIEGFEDAEQFNALPIINMLTRSPDDMGDEELEAHINYLRGLRTDHHQARKATATKPKESKSKTTVVNDDLFKDLLS